MACYFCTHPLPYLFFFFSILFSSSIPFVFPLSTVSISEIGNKTLVCALVIRGATKSFLNCSSFPSGIKIPSIPNTPFSAIVGGDGFLCGLISIPPSPPTSTLVCWRFSADGTIISYKRIYRSLALSQLEAGNNLTCGLVSTTNRLECWPRRGFNTGSMIRSFSSMAVGEDFVCGLEYGNISCLGRYKAVVDQVPGGNYSAIAAGYRHACAINLTRGLNCWGSFEGGIPPQGEFISTAVGDNRGCALRDNETVVCWGQGDFSLPGRLRETQFSTIKAKGKVFCGVLKSNLSLFCWGNENFNSDSAVFENVLPRPCRSACGPDDDIMEGSGTWCPPGQQVCQHCTAPPAAEPPPPPPPLESHQERCRGRCEWSGKMIAFLAVGCFGSLVLLLVIGFFLYKHCKCRGCRVHDSGPLDGTGPGATVEQGGGPSQPHPRLTEEAPPVLEKRLSQLTSMGNAGNLEEFSLQALLEATDNFSHDRAIGTGSFGSVYHGTLEDGREVAIKRAEISNTSSYAAIHKNENGVPRNVVDSVVPSIVHDEIHRVLDPRVPPPTPFEIEAVIYTGYLAADCVTLEGRDRPSMSDVVNSLERALAACLASPKSLSRSTTGDST
ncbi:hypothetical protein OIU84_027175 [Salix udensis]|uniref:non-specific serine/threonine protein kinase n=1 Tax=Salix udensis TaxID=889485 RepID=A0AAD6PA25_9ROSI|nr:hypothetical protein OIU84_027175 [Salix udensis]